MQLPTRATFAFKRRIIIRGSFEHACQLLHVKAGASKVTDFWMSVVAERRLHSHRSRTAIAPNLARHDQLAGLQGGVQCDNRFRRAPVRYLTAIPGK
jgi:hypothetical protein